MNIAAQSLGKYSAHQLKHLAELVGLNTTATKPVLAEKLKASLSSSARSSLLVPTSHNETPTRILSIDMGIRNLAYAVLEVRPDSLKHLMSQWRQKGKDITPQTTENSSVTEQMPRIIDFLHLLTWQRVDIYELELLAARPEKNLDGSPGVSTPLAEIENSTPTDDGTRSEANESFSPLDLASITYNLVTRVFLPFNVSHVLIERQRYRSGGAAAVMEWTVRVNMLESMLHAVFRTLREAALSPPGQSSKEHVAFIRDDMGSMRSMQVPLTLSVSPRKVGQFWDRVMPGFEDIKASIPDSPKPREKSKVEKERKIAIAASFLDQASGPPTLQCTNEAHATKSAFLAARQRQLSRRKGPKYAGAEKSLDLPELDDGEIKTRVTKLDDLADCLLQGTAWLQWEANSLYLRDWLAGVDAEESSIPKVPLQINKAAKKLTRKKVMKEEATTA